MTYQKIELPNHLNKNELYYGDNLEVMKSLPSLSIDLIYGDPPFYSQRNYSVESKVDVNEIRKFTDTFKDLNSYLRFLQSRLIEMKRLLKSTGSIYVHLDWHAVHYVKVEMDKIFGYENFRNEIIWFYHDSPGRPHQDFVRKHDTILRYTKSNNYTFNDKDIRVEIADVSKNRYEYTRILGGKSYGGGEYESAKIGKIPEDVWPMSVIKGNSKESIGYPTQKPEALLERIIKASSNDGDVVADFFGGSGTTVAVAQRLNRNWITCDNSKKSIDLIKARLLGNKSIKDKGYQIDVENAWM